MTRTARMVAAFRGHASEGSGALVDDPWASRLAGQSGAADAARYGAAQPHMGLFIAVRTAFLDAAVRRGLDEGIDQVVILGAGYDTRAARLARPGARFFEVDQPSAQEAKRAALRGLEGYPLDAATFVSCDFEHEDFLERAVAVGFDPRRRALMLWEGVVYYLTEDAVRATLRRVAEACHPASRLFFDYLGKRIVSGDVGAEDRSARDGVAEMGEPLRFGVDDVLPLLVEEGFRYVRTQSFDEMCLALTGTYERARKFRFQSIAEARVKAP